MSFIVRKLNYRPWPVSVAQQVCDADGQVTETVSTFVAHWKPFTEAELKAVFEAAEAAETAAPDAAADKPAGDALPWAELLTRNARVFSTLVVGWGLEVRGEDGASIPFSADALRDLIVGPDGKAISVGLHAALMEIRFGVAPAKNSRTSPVPGQTSSAGEGDPALEASLN